MKKLNRDEIEKKIKIYKLFQIKQIIIKTSMTKYEEKIN
jgi:hypothetical protein